MKKDTRSFYPLFFYGLSSFLFLCGVYDYHFPLKIEDKKNLEISHQHRTGIAKDIWISSGETRYHHLLLSPTSTVTLIPGEKGIDAIEQMQQIHCWRQQKIDPDLTSQKIQYIKALEGTYFYKDQEFLANQVIFAFYHGKGSDLYHETPPLQPFFQGEAKTAHFHLREKCHKFDTAPFEVVLDES